MTMEEIQGINRIRLEFKVLGITDRRVRQLVLIESDWNLKVTGRQTDHRLSSINRIRLEFKVRCEN